MSAPAQQVRARQTARSPARTTPLRKRPPLRAVPKRARRRSVGFWVLTALIVGAMVIGIAATYALIAQAAFQMRDLTQEQDQLVIANGDLRLEIANLTSEERIAKEARRSKLVFPETIEIIHVPDAAASGDGTRPSRDALTGGAG